MPNHPLVSIIIPTFNRRHFIGDAIDSCLAQTHPHCEIIVVDDGSADDTASFLRGRYGGRIQYIYQANQGPGIARNRGIAAAQGRFIHFCDADDQLDRRKIEICLDCFRQHPEAAVVYTYYQFVASDGRRPLETPPFPRFSEDIFCEMLRLTGCHILISSTMVRTAALRDVGASLTILNFAARRIGICFCAWRPSIGFMGLSSVWFIGACTAIWYLMTACRARWGGSRPCRMPVIMAGNGACRPMILIGRKRRGIICMLCIYGGGDKAPKPAVPFTALPNAIPRKLGRAVCTLLILMLCRRRPLNGRWAWFIE